MERRAPAAWRQPVEEVNISKSWNATQLSLEMQTQFKNPRECASFLRQAEWKTLGEWERYEFGVSGPVHVQGTGQMDV